MATPSTFDLLPTRTITLSLASRRLFRRSCFELQILASKQVSSTTASKVNINKMYIKYTFNGASLLVR
jgi:hypothetical protein